ncbi:uncharacterized protein LOC135975720 isoform X2 [Chrysemys picta bellii]|uniref:uncharacterized protein LOC135975720 isoform X2 n=1 Tax=Chrysemys picta bellii TaxID=8478 RepID=UPI0032B22FC4
MLPLWSLVLQLGGGTSQGVQDSLGGGSLCYGLLKELGLKASLRGGSVGPDLPWVPVVGRGHIAPPCPCPSPEWQQASPCPLLSLVQGLPGTQGTRRRNGWTWPQRRLLSITAESSSKAEKRRRPSSSCSCTPSTPRLAAQQRRQDTLEPHCCKAAVAERIVERIEELPDNSPPGAILANSLIAVGNLSTMTPAVEPELETHLLRAALHAFTLGMEKDTTQVQDLPRVLPDLLDAMLGNLLAESPDTDRLQYILEVNPMRGVGAQIHHHPP